MPSCCRTDSIVLYLPLKRLTKGTPQTWYGSASQWTIPLQRISETTLLPYKLLGVTWFDLGSSAWEDLQIHNGLSITTGLILNKSQSFVDLRMVFRRLYGKYHEILPKTNVSTKSGILQPSLTSRTKHFSVNCQGKYSMCRCSCIKQICFQLFVSKFFPEAELKYSKCGSFNLFSCCKINRSCYWL